MYHAEQVFFKINTSVLYKDWSAQRFIVSVLEQKVVADGDHNPVLVSWVYYLVNENSYCVQLSSSVGNIHGRRLHGHRMYCIVCMSDHGGFVT